MHVALVPSACILLLAGSGTVVARERSQQAAGEWEVRARILAIIGNFTAWPGGGDGDTSRPFVITVLGDQDAVPQLENALKGRKVKNRRPEVRYLRHWDFARIRESDLLYIGESEMDRLPEILRAVKGQRILTVAGTPAALGVMVNLPVQNQFIRVEVNLRRLREAGMEIAAAFLSKAQAKVVDG